MEWGECFPRPTTWDLDTSPLCCSLFWSPPAPERVQTSLSEEMNVDGSTIALVLDLGAHHLDLMFSDPADPPCAHAAREIERQRIRQWCEEAYQAQDDKVYA